MKVDFVFPKNNESEFIEMAQRLGYDKLIFLYQYGTNLAEIKRKIAQFGNKAEFGFFGVVV